MYPGLPMGKCLHTWGKRGFMCSLTSPSQLIWIRTRSRKSGTLRDSLVASSDSDSLKDWCQWSLRALSCTGRNRALCTAPGSPHTPSSIWMMFSRFLLLTWWKRQNLLFYIHHATPLLRRITLYSGNNKPLTRGSASWVPEWAWGISLSHWTGTKSHPESW